MQQKIHDERLMTRTEVEAHFGVSERYLVDLAVNGKGPVMVKFGRAVRYRAGDVRAWIEQSAVPPNGADANLKQMGQPAPKGNVMKEDLPLRILTMLKRQSAPSAEIEALAVETEAARDAFAVRTVEITEKLAACHNDGRVTSALKAEFVEARQTEEGLHRCAQDLRIFAKAQRETA